MSLTAAERLAVESWLATHSPTRAPRFTMPPREAGGRFKTKQNHRELSADDGRWMGTAIIPKRR